MATKKSSSMEAESKGFTDIYKAEMDALTKRDKAPMGVYHQVEALLKIVKALWEKVAP